MPAMCSEADTSRFALCVPSKMKTVDYLYCAAQNKIGACLSRILQPRRELRGNGWWRFLFSSAFQMQYPAEGQMVIIEPRSLGITLCCYAVAFMGLLALIGSRSIRNRAEIVVGLILLIIKRRIRWLEILDPLWVTIDKGRVPLFRDNWLGSDYVQSLRELKYATVETGDGAYRLVFVLGLRDGGRHRRSMGPFSDQPGQSEAAHA